MMDGKAAAPFLYGQGGFVSESVSGFCSPVGGGVDWTLEVGGNCYMSVEEWTLQAAGSSCMVVDMDSTREEAESLELKGSLS